MNTAVSRDVIDTGERLPAPMTPMAMLNQAIASGAGLEMVEKLMGLQERWEKNQARKAFDEAMAEAKSEIPVIFKNRTVDFTSAKGRTNYRHEDLSEIARTVDPILAKHGLSYRFRTTTDQGAVTVTCVVSHRDGHFEENTLSGGRDESGNKNHLQAVGSAITYLQRYTLKAALGLAASNDDDGKKADTSGVVTDAQADAINKLALEAKANVPKLLEMCGAESISDILAADYPKVMAALEAKRAKLAKGVQP